MDNLSLKYRPQRFEDVVGQEAVLAGLRRYLQNTNTPQSLLFSGPRGTGKTTTARLVAKTLNCQAEEPPCAVCSVCQDVARGTFVDLLEVDGATQRGIDASREMIELSHHSPVHKYKIFLVDEAHMLTREAANALLKALEEPPPNVLFILCTTEEHKILSTIKSRLKIYRFQLLPAELVVERLALICHVEGLIVSDTVLKQIAQLSEGSLRDAIKILDQAREQGEEITGEVITNLGVVSVELVQEFFQSLLVDRNLIRVFTILEDVSKTLDVNLFYNQCLRFLQNLLYQSIGIENETFLSQSVEKSILVATISSFLGWEKRYAGRGISRLALEAAVVQVVQEQEKIPAVAPISSFTSKTAKPKSDNSLLNFIEARIGEVEEEQF